MAHNVEMRNRRFVVLATFLVALNVALWIVPQGLALQRIVVSALFGPRMMRADVFETTGCPAKCVEWRIDRGVVVANQGGTLTVREADTKVQPIAVSPAVTKVTVKTGVAPVSGLGAIKTGWHVLVIWPAAGGAAQSVLVEKRGS